LIDFAADRRAPTPTAAAEMAVPVRTELIADIEDLARRSLACWRRGLDIRRTELRALLRAWPTVQLLLAIPCQRLDAISERLPRALRANAQIHVTQHSRIAARLTPLLLRARILRERERACASLERTFRASRILAERRRERLAALAARLTAGLRSNREAHRHRVLRDRERIEALFDRATRAVVTRLERHVARAQRAGQVLTALSYQGVLARGNTVANCRCGPTWPAA
jgi:exodeoxyribonuclease VII large subunit